MDPKTAQTWLPLLIIAVVFAFRFRNVGKPKEFKPAGLWVAPVLVTGVFAAMLVTQPPTLLGWLVVGFAMVLGGLVGWKRGQLVHFERDPRSGLLTMRQSPLALLFILVVILARRALALGLGLDGAPQANGHLAPSALVLADGMLGFAVGMVCVMRLTLWLRARAI